MWFLPDFVNMHVVSLLAQHPGDVTGHSWCADSRTIFRRGGQSWIRRFRVSRPRAHLSDGSFDRRLIVKIVLTRTPDPIRSTRRGPDPNRPTRRGIFALLLLLVLLALIVVFEVTEPSGKWTFGHLLHTINTREFRFKSKIHRHEDFISDRLSKIMLTESINPLWAH